MCSRIWNVGAESSVSAGSGWGKAGRDFGGFRQAGCRRILMVWIPGRWIPCKDVGLVSGERLAGRVRAVQDGCVFENLECGGGEQRVSRFRLGKGRQRFRGFQAGRMGCRIVGRFRRAGSRCRFPADADLMHGLPLRSLLLRAAFRGCFSAFDTADPRLRFRCPAVRYPVAKPLLPFAVAAPARSWIARFLQTRIKRHIPCTSPSRSSCLSACSD